MGERLELAGTKIGRLTPIRYQPKVLSSGRKMPAWVCRCDCGTETHALTVNLRKPGHTTSCGCLARENAVERARINNFGGGPVTRTHGASGTRAYGVWRAMLDRCYNERDYHHKWYGARGITVCDRWRFGEEGKTAFECWRDDMGPKPTPKHTLDRENNNGNYEPGNCRWATMTEQSRNRRTQPKKGQAPICQKGHALSPDNTYIIQGKKRCRKCQRERSARYYARKQAALYAPPMSF